MYPTKNLVSRKCLRITFYVSVPNLRALGPIIKKKTFIIVYYFKKLLFIIGPIIKPFNLMK